MKKLRSLSISLPMVAASFFGVASTASAAVVQFTSDQFNFTVGFQLNQSQFGDIFKAGDQSGNPGDSKGVNNGLDNGDFLFTPTLPNLNENTSPTNAIIDGGVNGVANPSYCIPVEGVIGQLPDAQIGECGRIFSSSGNNDAFAGLPTGTIGVIRNTDPANLPQNYSEPFIRITSTDNRQFDFILNSANLSLDGTNPSNITGLLTATGMVRQTDLTCSAANILALDPNCVTFGNTVLTQTLQGLRDDGLGGDTMAGDFITNPTSSSWSITVTPKAVPEPGTVMGLLAVAGLGSLASRKKRSK